MQMLAVPLQTETRPDEGLALTWFEVPGAIRYGLIIGVPGASMPELDVIMRGQTQQFAIVGVPSRFTGAVDIGTPPGETRQFGMVAYRNDGEILAVPSLHIHPARSAPRDREYHAVVPPALVDPNPPTPSSQQADPNDPWSALEATNAPAHGSATSFAAPAPPADAPSFTVPSPVSSPSTTHTPAPYDPWDVLSQPAAPEPPPTPTSSPAPTSTARYEAEAAQLPVEPAPRYEPPAPEYPAEPPIQAEPAPRYEPPAAEVPAEPSAGLEPPTTVNPAELTAEAGSPTTAVPDELDVTSAWAEPFASAATPALEAPVSTPPTPAVEGMAASRADAASAVGEGSDRQGEPVVEPESAPRGFGAAGEGAALASGEAEESPAAVVTPRAIWERGFAGPPETEAPAAQDEPVPPIIIDPLFHSAPPVPVAPPVPAAPPAPPAPPLPAALAAVLDEAELYLLPQWADHEAALRLLEQAEREAPEHPRVRDLRTRLEGAQGGGDNSAQLTALLEQADRSFKDQDYWAAVDHYERILSEEPDHKGALAGIAKARLRARWPTRLAGASGDSAALQTLGDEAATEAPDLAGQAYAAAFAIQPGVDVLRGWLIAFVHAGHGEVLPGTARRAVKVLEERGKILSTPAVAQALDGLDQAAAGDPAETESAANHLCDTLVSAVP
ncbi:MAG TPA: hypothetical protein VN837_15940 [Chloroflexota bacterium]|nr:hypothetical protein [Chloroflexota bacterium]